MRATLEPGSSRKIHWVRVAAVLALAAITTIPAAHYFTQPKTQLIETPKGGQERLTLADGSQIELNTDSAVRINLNSHARAVELLRGEVFFQIKHDPEHPFVVIAANRRIIDLGTKFIVRANSRNLQISLLEGRVRLEGSREEGGSHATDLLPGDIATVTAEATRVSQISERNLEDRLAWRRGSIVFHNASLTEVVAEFNRYGGSQPALANSDDGKLRITGAFRITGSEAFAANAHELFGLKIERRNGVIVLSR